MNGSTLFETNPSTRTTSFDRPPPLKIPSSSTQDSVKSAWGSHRGLWQSNGSVTTRTAEAFADRPSSLRQKSTSSTKFGGASNGAALSPIENPRGPARPSNNPWTSSNISPVTTRHPDHLISPAKQQRQVWPFPDDLDFDSENSLLLRGSAPDIDTMEEQTPRNAFGNDVRSHFGAREGSNGAINLNHSNGSTYRHSSNANSTNGTAMINHTSGLRRQVNGVALTSGISPTSRQFGTVPNYSNGDTFVSPTSTKFGQGRPHEAHPNNVQQQGHHAMDDATESMRSMTLNSSGARITNLRGGSDPFGNVEYAPVQRYQNGGHGLMPQLRVNVEHADFQPSAASNAFEIADDSLLPAHGQSMWAYSGRGTPYSGDMRNHNQGQYYSAAATPPTGSESGRSVGGGGISSRTSHQDFTQLERKFGNLDAYQQNPFLQANGVVPANTPAYDFSYTPSIRMNPLAGAYTPYSMTGYSVASIGGYSPTPRMPPREQEPQVIRSPLLEDFRMNSKTNKRYELRDIFNHVVEFSGDQHGSRFIQQKLEGANSDEKDQIFKEIQSNCLQLMTDVFGNYVIQKLFDHGNQSQKKLLANHMKGHVLTLSTQMYGCRVVQKALEHVLTDQQASMVKELDGPNKQILKVIRDQNGNHVVQKAIERVPAEHIHFIIEAHRGEVIKLAAHTYGCRVIQRILEHCEPPAKRIILDELHGCVAPLITDSFGNYVVQHVIQTGEPDDRRRVVSIVQHQLVNFSKHKFASNVVEKCIEHADADQRADIVARLIGPLEQGQTPVLGLLRDQYGNYVIQKIHSFLRGAELEALTNEMKLCLPQLKRTSYGKQVLAIEKLLYGNNSPTSASMPGYSSASTHTSPGNHVNSQGPPPQLHFNQPNHPHGSIALPMSTFGPH